MGIFISCLPNDSWKSLINIHEVFILVHKEPSVKLFCTLSWRDEDLNHGRLILLTQNVIHACQEKGKKFNCALQLRRHFALTFFSKLNFLDCKLR